MTLEEAIALLRRAVPELEWAENHAYSEYLATLDDHEIVEDIRKALVDHDRRAES